MFTTPRLVVIALCAALNFSIGNIVYLLKLPLYLNSIGVILCALLLAPDRKASFFCAWMAGLMSTVTSFLLINPFILWFELTDISIAFMAAFVVARGAETFRARPMNTPAFAVQVVLYGVLTGIVAAIVSAPIVAFLFGGVTGSGSAFIVALFLKAGQQLLEAAVLSGLTAEPIDKTLQVLFAALLYRATPSDLIALLHRSELQRATRA